MKHDAAEAGGVSDFTPSLPLAGSYN